MKLIRQFVILFAYYVYALFSCFFLFCGGFLVGRHRKLLYRIAAHFGPFPPIPNKPKALIPSIPSSKLVADTTELRILEAMPTEGNVTLFELLVIVRLAKHFNSLRLFEIGTFDGRTALNLAANCPEPAQVFSLDLPKGELRNTRLELAPSDALYIEKDASGARWRGTPYEHKISQLYGDSAVFDFSPYVNGMDFVFVDGSHAYGYVLNDTRRAVEMLRDGFGVIMWHDSNYWIGWINGLSQYFKS